MHGLLGLHFLFEPFTFWVKSTLQRSIGGLFFPCVSCLGKPIFEMCCFHIARYVPRSKSDEIQWPSTFWNYVKHESDERLLNVTWHCAIPQCIHIYKEKPLFSEFLFFLISWRQDNSIFILIYKIIMFKVWKRSAPKDIIIIFIKTLFICM